MEGKAYPLLPGAHYTTAGIVSNVESPNTENVNKVELVGEEEETQGEKAVPDSSQQCLAGGQAAADMS